MRIVKKWLGPTVLSFAVICNELDLPIPEEEFVFAAPRRWRFDYAWPQYKIALEVEGAIWTGGRHTRGAGFLRDMEKYNKAASLGWLVLRATPKTLFHDATLDLIRSTIKRAT